VKNLAGLIALFFVAAPGAAAQVAAENESLIGLKAVRVITEKLDADVEKLGLRQSDIMTDVELRLRRSGITVLGRETGPITAAQGVLVVDLSLSSTNENRGFIYRIDVELMQPVLLKRNVQLDFLATTWSSDGLFGLTFRDKLRDIRNSVLDQVDKFVNSYLAMNPGRAKQ
jgi:hypothetical protein